MGYDAYNYPKKLKVAIKGLDGNVSKENRELLDKFYNDCLANSLGLARITRLIYNLRLLAGLIGRGFESATKEDIILAMGKLEQSRYADSTKNEIKVSLKKFYKWLRGGEEYPPEVKWIKPKRKNGHKLPEELLTEEEIKLMIEASNNPRDRALVAVLYESGCRAAELLSMRIKHIVFDSYGAQIIVFGKTGQRRVRIIASVPFLQEWINNHKDKNNPEAPLWTIWKREKLLQYGILKKMLRILAKRAGLKKRIYPHLFRHSRATYLANHLTEAQMKEHFGWVQASKMASVYVHLSGSDVDNALLKTYGIKSNGEERQESALKPKVCIRCRESNEATNKFCRKCGMVIDEKTMIEIVQGDTERKKADEIMDRLIQDEEFKKMFMEKIKVLIG